MFLPNVGYCNRKEVTIEISGFYKQKMKGNGAHEGKPWRNHRKGKEPSQNSTSRGNGNSHVRL